jgi:uncharacterized membrane protein required for colicin V production
MLDLAVVYFFLLALFAVVGFLRGWQREVIAAAGLVASIAALSQFGHVVVELLTDIPAVGTDPVSNPEPFRRMFWVQFGFHSFIAFVSYQMVSRLADLALRGRLGERLRTGLESKIIGTLFGLLNGYLYIGALWGFLEYALNQGTSGYWRLNEGFQYAFTDVITRPVIDSLAWNVAGTLPQIFSPTAWLVGFFIVFFFVIIALI